MPKTNTKTERSTMTDRQVEQACRRLYRQGYVTKSSILRALRDSGESVSQQRLYPIAERVIEEKEAKKAS